MKKKILFIVYFSFFLCNIFAASNKGNYFIYNVRFDTQGITKPFAILRSAEIRKGEHFNDIVDLENYITRKTQILRNQRTLENAEIEYKEVGKDRWGRVMIDLLIHTKDSNNFLIFPEPKYSSSDGVRLALKLRDNNFLGTNTPLRLDLEWNSPNLFVKEENPYGQDSLSLRFAVDIPFNAADYNWIFSFDNKLKYFFKNNNLPQGLIFNNSTGLSLEIPLARTTFGLGYKQGTTINQEYSKWKKNILDSNVENIWYLTSSGYLGWKVPLWIRFDPLDELTYNVEAGAGINYATKNIDLADRSGGSVYLSHDIGFDKIDWIDNFRNGFNINVSNNNGYNFRENLWDYGITANVESHFVIEDIAGISIRAHGIHHFNDTRISSSGVYNQDDLGGRQSGYLLRGIDDDMITADSMIVLNLDFSFLVFKFAPSTWTNKNKPLKLFDFEVHLGPSFDLGVIRGRQIDKKLNVMQELYFDPKFWLYTAGAEVMVYPLAFRSFFLRLSVAFNLSRSIPGNFLNYEIDLSTGHFY